MNGWTLTSSAAADPASPRAMAIGTAGLTGLFLARRRLSAPVGALTEG